MKAIASKFYSALLVFALALASAFFTGCLFSTKDERQAGGAEDFPNTLEVLGKAAIAQIETQGEWDEFGNMPSAVNGLSEWDSSLTDSETVSPRIKLGLAKKTAMQADTVFWDMRDTTQGYVRRIYVRNGLGVQRDEDTLVFAYDEAFKANDYSAVTVLARHGRSVRLAGIKAWSFTDGDAVKGVDQGNLTYVANFAQSVRSHFIEVRVDSTVGAQSGLAMANLTLLRDTLFAVDRLMQWRNFEPVSYRFVRVRGADTLETLVLRDADGDGRIFKGDSGWVSLVHVTVAPPLRPSIVQTLQRSRGWLLREDLRFIPRFYHERREERDGKTVDFRVRGLGLDSAYAQGDTLVVDNEVNWPEPAQLASRRDVYRVLLAEPTSGLKNRMLQAIAVWNWRSGLLQQSRLVFRPLQPASAGQLQVEGKVTMTLVYTDGRTGELDGDYTREDLNARYTEAQAGSQRRFKVTWDKFGQLRSRAVDAE